MKYLLFFGSFLLFQQLQAQQVKLTNAVVISQFDKEEDRYAMQALMADLLKSYQIKALPVMNVLKQGEDLQHLLQDSIQKMLVQKGFDTYLVVNVRGYDRQFRLSTKIGSLLDELNVGHMFPLFRDEITSITFEFNFFRDNKLIHTELLRLRNVSTKEKVIQKLHKKLPSRIKRWKPRF